MHETAAHRPKAKELRRAAVLGCSTTRDAGSACDEVACMPRAHAGLRAAGRASRAGPARGHRWSGAPHWRWRQPRRRSRPRPPRAARAARAGLVGSGSSRCSTSTARGGAVCGKPRTRRRRSRSCTPSCPSRAVSTGTPGPEFPDVVTRFVRVHLAGLQQVGPVGPARPGGSACRPVSRSQPWRADGHRRERVRSTTPSHSISSSTDRRSSGMEQVNFLGVDIDDISADERPHVLSTYSRYT